MSFPLNETVTKSFPTVFNKGREIKDAVTVVFGDGFVYEGWETIGVSHSMEAISRSFNLELTDKWRPENAPKGGLPNQSREWPFKPGTPVHIKIGKQPVLTGYIDRVDVSMAPGERVVTIQGRDKTGDLVDSSAYIGGPMEFKNLNIKQLAEKFCFTLGVDVTVDKGVDIGKAFPKFTVKQGETIFEMLKRAAKQRGLLMRANDAGDLVFTNRSGGALGEAPEIKSATSSGLIAQLQKTPSLKDPKASFNYDNQNFRAKADVVLKQGQNILEARAEYDNTNRFREYLVKGQQPASDLIRQLNATSVEASAFDNLIDRPRIKVILADQSIDTEGAKQRANWEVNMRAIEGVQVNVKVQGWLQQPDGRLWQPNELVRIEAGMIGMSSQEMLIVDVNFNKSTDGTFTTLRLARPDAFNVSRETLEVDPGEKMGHELPTLKEIIEQARNLLNA